MLTTQTFTALEKEPLCLGDFGCLQTEHHGVIRHHKGEAFDKAVCRRAVPMWQQLEMI